jgi:hypothetical protein
VFDEGGLPLAGEQSRGLRRRQRSDQSLATAPSIALPMRVAPKVPNFAWLIAALRGGGDGAARNRLRRASKCFTMQSAWRNGAPLSEPS